MAGTQETRLRWALGIQGVLSIVFAAVILIWPGLSLFGPGVSSGRMERAGHTKICRSKRCVES